MPLSGVPLSGVLLGCAALIMACGLAGAGILWVTDRSDGPGAGDGLRSALGPAVDSISGRNTDGLEGPGARSGRTTGNDSGDTLILPGASPSTLDPALVRDVVSAEYMYEIYSGLVTLSPDLEIVPDLAAEWSVSADGTRYTFALRSGAVFHDGRPVTPADVKWSIERACSRETGSAVAGAYLDDIVGCIDSLTGRATGVVGVTVLDDRRVEIRIDAPKGHFLAKLTYPTGFVLDRIQLEADPNWQAAPNGTGPFRLAEHVPDERIVLAANKEYFGEPANLEQVVFDLRPISALTRFENGELDAAPVGLLDLERVKDPLNPLSRLVVEGSGDLGLQYIGFNVRKPPFDDPAVRRAFVRALDKERLARVALRGAVRPVDGILPPGMPGYTEDIAPYGWDPARARSELAASAYGTAGEMPPIVLNVGGGAGGSPGVQAVADMLEETLGLEVQIEQAPWEVFQAEIEAGRYQAWFLGWSADYPDPQNFLDVLFHSRSPLNHTGFTDTRVDSLLEDARTERDLDERHALYTEAEREILMAAPWLPLYTGVDTWLVGPHVEGFTLPPLVVPHLARVRMVGGR